MVRGGSWNNNQDNARAAYRNRNHPDNRNNNIGFRLVCSSHTLGSLPRRGLLSVYTDRPLRALPPAMPGTGSVSGMAADHGLRSEAKELKMARACPVRKGS